MLAPRVALRRHKPLASAEIEVITEKTTLEVLRMFKSVSTMIPAVDLERAVKFCSEILELKKVRMSGGMATVQCSDGTQMHIYQRGQTNADHNVAMFLVDDIAATVKRLKEKSVTFEELDMPDQGIKTVNGIATLGQNKGAWFKDTEGNTFMIAE